MESSSPSPHVVWHPSTVTNADQSRLNGHHSAVLWLTGLSGSGKSTLANAVSHSLYHRGVHTYVLDGDNIRHGLCKDLGFGDSDRAENIRRIGEVSKLFADAGLVVLTAFVSPFRGDRLRVRSLIESMGNSHFIEIYCATSLDICEERDSKGLYRKARLGDITHFTGISSPYEEPENPELILETGNENVESCTLQVVRYLEEKGIIPTV